MPPSPRVITTNSGPIGTQIATQIVHGSVYNTVSHSAAAAVTPSDSINDDSKLDDALLASLAFPEMFDRRATIEKPHPSTCQWILWLDEFNSWHAGSQGLLWIKGKPGAGKSTLMSFLYSVLKQERGKQPGIHLDFFFSARGCELQKTPVGMYRSLLNQLFVQSEKARPMLRGAFREKHDALRSRLSEWSWQHRDLEDLFFDVLTAITEDAQTTIFIDALDEAGDLNAQKLARSFHKLNDNIASTSKKVKVCLSCRHYPFVSRIQAVEVCVEDHNKDDIASFIRDRLDIAALDRDDPGHEWQKVEAYLFERAGGIFQWADLTVAAVERAILQGDSPEMVKAWIQDVPLELRDCYERILRTQIDRRHRTQSSLLFVLVCYAKRPLSLTEIGLALAAAEAVSGDQQTLHRLVPSEKVMRQRVKTLSGGLIEAVSVNVQIIHQSVYDFLNANGLDLIFELEDNVNPQFLSSISWTNPFTRSGRSHLLLHRCCLNYLAAVDPDVVHGFRQIHEMFTVFSLLDYAAFNLFVHAEHAATFGDAAFGPYFSLLEAVFPRWLHIYRGHYGIYSNCPAPGSTFIHVATTHRLFAILRHLAKEGRDLNVKDGLGYTALHVASMQGSIELAQILIHGGIDAAALSLTGDSFLDMSIKNGHTEFAEWALTQDEHRELAKRSIPPLHIAAARGKIRIVQILHELATNLIDSDNTVDLTQNGDVSALTVTTSQPEQIDTHKTWASEYRFALLAASQFGHTEIVKLLIPTIAKLRTPGAAFDHALCAAADENHIPIIGLLLCAGASPNATFQDTNALCLAAERGHIEAVHTLLGKGADVVCKRKPGLNAFEAAAAGGRPKVVEALIPLIEQLRTRDVLYNNAIRKAIVGEHYSVVELLLTANPHQFDAAIITLAVKRVWQSKLEHERREHIDGTYAPRMRSRAPERPKSTGKYRSTINSLRAYQERNAYPVDIVTDPPLLRPRKHRRRSDTSISSASDYD